MPYLKRESFLRIADTAALVASCGAIGMVALKMGIVLCGAGLLVLGTAFLAGDVWRVVRASQDARRTAAYPGVQIWQVTPATSRRIALRPGGD